ncbi:NUDIX domain-containing protein [Nocardioides marmoraquaticus]
MPVELIPVAAGVVRLSWPAGAGASDVRAVVAAAFADGSTRVEAHVHPDDRDAQRVATFSGLLREGVARGVGGAGAAGGAGGAGDGDRVVYARLVDDTPVEEPEGFRRLLNSFLPRKRAIAQLLVRDHDDRVLLCQLTYKRDHDLPGGVVEVGESPHLAVAREVREELALDLSPGALLLTDWLPPWSGWDDAVCLVFDGGAHDPSVLDAVVHEEREIRDAAFRTVEEVRTLCADFTARRVEAALAQVGAGAAAYAESGRVLR